MPEYERGPEGGGEGGESTPTDGFAYSCGFPLVCSYATSKTTCTDFNDDSTDARIGQDRTPGPYGVGHRNRTFMKFDTAEIPENATIISAKLMLKGKADISVTDFNIILRKWTGDVPINCGDYNSYDGTNYGSFSTSGFQVNEYNEITITNFDLITKAGKTMICILSDRDLGNNEPSRHEYVDVYTSEYAVGYLPILYVEYELAVVEYTLTINVSGEGTTDPAPGEHTYEEDSEVPVTHYPSDGWKLDYWTLDDVNVGSDNPYTVTMDDNHTLVALFTEIPPPPAKPKPSRGWLQYAKRRKTFMFREKEIEIYELLNLMEVMG